MSNSNTCLLNLLFREACCDADFEGWLELPALLFSGAILLCWHRFQTGDQYTIGKSLRFVSMPNSDSAMKNRCDVEGSRTSSTHSWRTRSCSPMLSRRELMISGFRTSSITGFSGELVQVTQSLLGSSCARMAFMFSRHWDKMSGFVCNMFNVSLAVVASIAGRAAENV
jgi:hypothetical protein